MCFLISAAARDSTSSRSSEAFTSSAISASVANASADTSPCGATFTGTDISDGSISNMVADAHAVFATNLRFGPPKRGDRTGPPSGPSMGNGRQRQDSNVRQVPITFGVVQAVAHHEFVGNGKTSVVGVHVDQPAFFLVQQHGDPEILGLALLQNAQQIFQSQTGVQNVLDHDDRLALDAGIEILVEFDLAGGLG